MQDSVIGFVSMDCGGRQTFPSWPSYAWLCGTEDKKQKRIVPVCGISLFISISLNKKCVIKSYFARWMNILLYTDVLNVFLSNSNGVETGQEHYNTSNFFCKKK